MKYIVGFVVAALVVFLIGMTLAFIIPWTMM